MNATHWRQRRDRFASQNERQGRGYCKKCLRPPLTCYCKLLQPFDPTIQFAILIHGREAQKRIATGRLAHHSLKNSLLLPGYDYSQDKKVNSLLQDSSNHCVVLYPGNESKNLSSLSAADRLALFPEGKNLVVFVIDGTWITARKTMQRSINLQSLPRFCFSPGRPSNFRVRKQPQENFFSTIEAIHETIELVGPSRGFDLEGRVHDTLLQVFDHMVNQQIELASAPKSYCLWKPRATPPR